jgi:hypothetical protein
MAADPIALAPLEVTCPRCDRLLGVWVGASLVAARGVTGDVQNAGRTRVLRCAPCSLWVEASAPTRPGRLALVPPVSS